MVSLQASAGITKGKTLTGGHFEKIKGIDNIGLLPIFCQQTMDKGRSQLS